MSIDAFTLSWFITFALIILIAFIANLIIILAILKDQTMHTSTYFYIINVNLADILLLLTCLPERFAEVFGSREGFHLGMFTCYLIPFLQQVSMHAALGFLLVLTIHRCYPAGVPRFLQGDLMRRQIRSYSQTLTIVWIFAILINLPLFSITKYERVTPNESLTIENPTNLTSDYNCYTGATEIWSRLYLISLLVCTYLITGIFLIVIYGQAIRIILASKKYAKNPLPTQTNNMNHYRYLSGKNHNVDDQYCPKLVVRMNAGRENLVTHASSSPLAGSSNRRQQQSSTPILPSIQPISIPSNDLTKSTTNSHSTQHLQVIVMLFIVILLYILLLLPYRLFNLLLIVHNKIFQQTNMNDHLFRWLLNTVRLLVFLNCALQPITYLIISSRLRQTVITFLKFLCQCRRTFSSSFHVNRHYKNDQHAYRTCLSQKDRLTTRHMNKNNRLFHQQHERPLQTSLNNIHLVGNFQSTPLPLSRSHSPIIHSPIPNETRHIVSFNNGVRK